MYKRITVLILTVLTIVLLPITVYANSSWRWISETRPFDVLPFVAIGTILIETLAISIIPRHKNPAKVFCVVTFANLLSFASTYLFFLPGSLVYTFEESLKHFPIYTVGIFYLALTLLVELPVVYFLLGSGTEKKRAFLWTVVLCNVETTVIVSFIERLLCYGKW